MRRDLGRPTLVFVLLGAACGVAVRGVSAMPGYGVPWAVTSGTVYAVSTMAQLGSAVQAANNAGVPATILLADGTYVLDDTMLHLTCPHLIVRGAGGDREAVVVRGPDEGPEATAHHIFLVSASWVTIADMTLGYCRYHGIQVRGESPADVAGLRAHNCHLKNCNEQFIKGSSSAEDPVGATDGIIENCLFEFTGGWAFQYYTGGIDIHKGVNWTVRDNLFRNIRVPDGQSGMAEHAVHFWNRCTNRLQNVVVERNRIVNCDRGIGFGLGSFDGGHNGGASVIRNNFVFNDGTGSQTDVGIGLEYASGVKVDNNTVVTPYWAPVEYRFAASSNLVFRNNLSSGPITNRDGAPVPALSNNVQNAQAAWFRDAASGDLHILPGRTNAIDRGVAIGEFADDLDADARPRLGGWDVGADEYDPDTADSDGDLMPDGWEQAYGLSPTNAADAGGDADVDGKSNREEWICGTDPTNGTSFFRIERLSCTGIAAIAVASATNRAYTLERNATLASNGWAALPGQSGVPGPGGPFSLVDTNPPAVRYYRVRVVLADD